MFPTWCILRPQLKGFSLELGTGAVDQNTRMTGYRIKKFGDIFSRLDTMHQNDRRTPGDSKSRSYA